MIQIYMYTEYLHLKMKNPILGCMTIRVISVWYVLLLQDYIYTKLI